METDRQTDKATRWAFTAFEAQWELFKVVPEITAEQGWQIETCPDTSRKHYQGYIRTKRQCRFAQMKKAYPGVHLEVARNWDALVNYCKKVDTAHPDTQVLMKGTTQMTMAKALTRLASFAKHDPPELVIEAGMNVRVEKSFLLTQEYWMLVTSVLKDDPDAVGMYTNNVYLSAWKNTREVWIELFENEEPLVLRAPESPCFNLGDS